MKLFLVWYFNSYGFLNGNGNGENTKIQYEIHIN